MFCQQCGKEILDQAVVCVGCGCTTPSGTSAVGTNVVKAWGWVAMFSLVIVSLLIPLVGWIVGGINMKHYSRKDQALALVICGFIGFAVSVGINMANM